MIDEAQTEIFAGLSEEEKDDLEKLIKVFREKKPGEPLPSAIEVVQKQILSMHASLAQFAETLLKFDAKMKSFSRILRLSNEKSEIMNQRIDAIIEIMKGRRNL